MTCAGMSIMNLSKLFINPGIGGTEFHCILVNTPFFGYDDLLTLIFAEDSNRKSSQRNCFARLLVQINVGKYLPTFRSANCDKYHKGSKAVTFCESP